MRGILVLAGFGSPRRLLVTAATAAIAFATVLLGCRETPQRTRLLVVGVDGADWEAIETLWDEGRLPNLRAIAERGVATRLATAYGKSPVIWTTVATGVAPRQHGIRDFVVPTEQGDLPVSSVLRRSPALWNMLSREGLRVGVVSWWASWPAEAVEGGVVLSDRVVAADGLAEISGRVSPPELEAELPGWLARAREADRPAFGRDPLGVRDRLSTLVGRWLLEERDLDLLMVYLRAVDVVSHLHWKEFEPERFGGSAEERRAGSDPVTAAYVATDQAIGMLIEQAGADWNVMVISDHGFLAMQREERRVQLDLDQVLDALGLLRRDDSGAVDVDASTAYAFVARRGEEVKPVRWGASAGEDAMATLERGLARVTWGDGAPTFRLREAKDNERRRGADAVVVVLVPDDDERLLLDGEPLSGVDVSISRQSGTHVRDTAGVLFAAGPDVDPSAELAGVGVHDIAPTVLAAFGLPVGEDFAGVARRELWDADLRERHPPRSIASWGRREAVAAPEATEVDDEILDDLRALGYLD